MKSSTHWSEGMHELAVCQSLMSEIDRISAQNGHATVKIVVIRIGVLSGVEPALMRSAFPIASAGSIAEHAELLVNQTKPVIFCPACGEENEVSSNRILCPSCKAWRVELIAGDELVLESVELLAA